MHGTTVKKNLEHLVSGVRLELSTSHCLLTAEFRTK